ncbi:hypothetical protein PBI_SCTP2_189 [Salicola phage SCTP-2]|nr:hypothetical protein PBI_SCTP2_189 [Salicola phage SCTP-2]
MQQSSDKLFDKRSERLTGLYMGLIKENKDFQRMGRLEVWISELCSKSDDTIPVIYASPFAGATNPDDTNPNELETFDGTQKSYGFWAIPPDINNTVLVMFIDGHISKGVWFSVLYQQYINNMIPNIPVDDTFQEESKGDGVKRPSAEYNINVKNATQAVQGTKPYHKPHYEGIRNQGLKRDPIRGFSQNGARANRRSKVLGMLSPGGHYWTLEDTENDEKIRLRTKSGTQLLLDETRGNVYIINKSGKGWIEIDNDGKIMAYGEQGIGIRSQGDINLHADNDIIFEAGRDMITKTKRNTHFENMSFFNKSKDKHVVNVKNMKTEKLGQHHISVKDDFQLSSTEVKIGCDSKDVNTKTCSLTASDSMEILSNNTSLTASNAMNILGSSSLVMSTGGTLTQTSTSMIQNVSGLASPSSPAEPTKVNIIEIPDLDTYSKNDIEQPHSDNDPKEIPIEIINTIYPTHEPCPDHSSKPEKR